MGFSSTLKKLGMLGKLLFTSNGMQSEIQQPPHITLPIASTTTS